MTTMAWSTPTRPSSPSPTWCRSNVNAGADQTVNEGTPVNLSGSLQRSGLSRHPHQDLERVASNGQVIADGSATSFSFTPNDNGTYTVTYTVTDDDGGMGIPTTAVITVNNVALAERQCRCRPDGQRRHPGQLSGTFSDPGTADTHTQAWSVSASNGQVIADGSGATFSFTPNDNGTYTVTYTVTDDDGGSELRQRGHHGQQRGADKANAGADQTVNEGTLVTLIGHVQRSGHRRHATRRPGAWWPATAR